MLYQLIRDHLPNLVRLPHCGLGCISPLLWRLLFDLMLLASLGFIIIAVADFVFQRFQFMKEMRMTKQEIKQKYKEMEGDPRTRRSRASTGNCI
ncbi:EscU/YscU/HrcU family type III secretion system export apparatus switch protein [Caldichromatium japonicum]|uniref:EscU/YscU/HrcU family type III secretion system export apparatus switch protein n=1 Tax=Caldichromatium japonicum TaxID=2699430 RepID=A0A6G7VCI5_9GAMM|nr:EscU/YscU/HrcU family type III secretion system export apparatus switch protein [Caldichromatium japonicum]QIK37769.1 EscU/YscU/HrcU family type III secretion system export apparatus switch protein [Caldichromatium japonicum]